MAKQKAPDDSEEIQEGEIVKEKVATKAKKPHPKRGNIMVFLAWLLSVFLIVISARLIALPSNEFPVALTIIIVLLSIYVIVISYGASITPSSTRALLPNLFAIILMYLVPAILAIVLINNIVPKTEISRQEKGAIELQYSGYDMSFWLDADITYYRPFVSLFPFDTLGASVGNVYYNGETYDIGECIDTDSHNFYKGEEITCPTIDGLYGKVRLNLDKLPYKIAPQD